MSSDSQQSPKTHEPDILIEVKRLERLDEPPPPPPRKGFLPIDTNLFDRFFISIMSLVAIHLVWMRFIEAFLPIGFATGIALIVAYVIIRWG